MSDQVALKLSRRTRLAVNRDLARQAYRDRNPTSFVDSCVIRHLQLEFVIYNSGLLRAGGMYEQCLLYTFTGPLVNNHYRDVGLLRLLFSTADRKRLRAAGTPIPAGRKLRLYRGIAGRGNSRHPDGVAWTRSLDVACYYALNSSPEYPGLENPVVLTAEVKTKDILACEDRFCEQEVFWVPGEFEQLPLTPEQIEDHAARHRRTGALSVLKRFERLGCVLPAEFAAPSP